MKMYIDPRGGMAGDMFAAALIDAGAGADRVTGAMLGAARKLGNASVKHVKTSDGSSRLIIEVEHHHGYLSSSKALQLLSRLMDDFHVEEPYRDFGFRVLKNLIYAENIAHQTWDFEVKHHHHHHNQSGEASSTDVSHDQEEPEAWLHEAQDILIDVMGAVMGLQVLGAPVKAVLTYMVSYGGGTVTFSHGTLEVPAPATSILIEENELPVIGGPVETELLTPTGAALLSALEANEVEPFPRGKILMQGASRGAKDLEIPPLKVMFY